MLLTRCGVTSRRLFWVAVQLVAISWLYSPFAKSATINFVQSNYAVPQTPQSTVTIPFSAAQAGGDLNVVVVAWFDTTTTVRSVIDTKGNAYALAVGPTALAGGGSQSIYYAKNIAAAAANANVVTVTFSSAAPYPDIRIFEYVGLDPANPLDVTAAASGNSATSSSGAATTTSANDLVFGANYVTTSTTGPGAGFTARLITSPDGDIGEDMIVSAAGSYSATATLAGAGMWIMQMVAFRAVASGPADTTPPTAPTNLTASAASSSHINLTWGASTDPDSPSITYHVERCQGSGCTSFAAVGTTLSTSFGDTSLLPSTSYSYRVRASDPAGNLGPYSNTASASTAGGGPTGINFVQSNYAVPQTPQSTVTIPFSAAQAGGDLNVVVVAWFDTTTTVRSVIDTKGNAYALAVGPTALAGGGSQSIYYAKNIAAAAANANVVTVTFSSAAPYPDIRIFEYVGLDNANPLDVTAAASGNSATSSSGAATTTSANDLIFGANYVTTSTTGPGAGFTARLITSPDGDIGEDMIVSAVGSYSATATLAGAGMWIMQMVAFRAVASGPADTTPPTAPTNLTASAASSSQINLTWGASTDADSPSITYHVERCQGSGCTSFAAVGTTLSTSFGDTSLLPSTSYSYRVRASDPAGNLSPYSNTASATTSGGPNVGQWSAPFTWPMVGIHTTLMPNGKVLTWEDENVSPAAQVWDPSTSSFTAVPYNISDLFCSGHTVLPDGRVMVAGGHNGANYNGLTALTFFDPSTQTWSAGPDMSYARWYPTVTALPDGRQLVTSGAINCQGCNANTPEVYDPKANTWTKLTNATIDLPLYPHLFVLPDGRVLVTGSYELPVVAQALNLNTQTWTTIDPNSIDAGSAVMYLPGKILKSGTSANSSAPYVSAVPNAYVLDMTQASPAWAATGTMAFARTYHNLTSLPDGTVLATGGQSYTDPFDLSTAVFAAEIWSPATGQWTTMASMKNPRVYHSIALLLPDARVLVAGSGQYGGDVSLDQLTGEIYSPPYLSNGPRPVISSAPSTLQYAQQFSVQTPNAASIASVVLIRLGSVTHAFNQNQRYVPLSFSAGSGALTVTAPTNVNLAPPGYYMLFIVNSSGVPSVATILNLPVPSGANSPTAPSNLTATASTGKVVLAWTGSTGPLGVANYNVHRSTAASFTPSTANRIAQPTATTYTDYNFTSSGTYYYLVTAADSAGNVSPPSNEAVAAVSADVTPPSVSLTAPTSGATVSGSVTVSANASDDVVVTGVQFQVDGTNIGSRDTTSPYSVSWNSSGVTNGSHTLTAVATDGANLSTTSSGVTVTVNNTQPANIGFVQGNYSVPQAPQSSVPVTFSSAQTAGDLNVVVVGWSDTASLISSVTDTKGNVYVLAVGPTTVTGVESQAVYFAKNVAATSAGGNTVTVKFSAAVPYPDIRVLEYSGLDTSNPLDVTAAATGTGTTTSSGAVTTTNANDLIVGANYVTSSTSAPGAGFTTRIITSPDGDIAEDDIVSTSGSYNATAHLASSGSWIMQLVAFRAAESPVPAISTAPR